jgi:hypothetical protein
MTLSKDNYIIHHGIELAEKSCIVNCEIESLAQDPEVIRVGRIWYNLTENKIKYSKLDDDDNVIVQTFGEDIEFTHEILSTQDYILYTVSNQIISGTESVYVNGLLQRLGQSYDYTFLNNNIVFTSSNQESDIVSISYIAMP